MDDIAKAAGFTKPILYQYFASKTDLYREIVTLTGSALMTRMREAVAVTEGSRAKIEVAFSIFFHTVVEETDAFRILFLHAREGEVANDLRAVEMEFVGFIEPLIGLRIKPDHRRHLAAGVVGIAEGIATAWLFTQEERGWPVPPADTAVRLANRAARLAWGGLRSTELEEAHR